LSSPTDIRALLESGRGSTVDWLPEGAAVAQIAQTLVGMANASGGTLLLGVAPRSNRVQGLAEPQATADKVAQAALLSDPPLILPRPETVMLENQTVIAANVPAGLPQVYALDGRYLVREKTTNGPLSAGRLRKLLLERGEVSFDSTIPDGAALSDLDGRKVEDYLRHLPGLADETPQEALLGRGCVRLQGKELCPTAAGLLLFGKQPQRWAPGADILAARFSGREMSDEFVREGIEGALPDQLRLATGFLAENIRKVARLSGLAREEQPEFPLEAVREVVVNAVAHRDYSIRGDNIRVLLFSDRLEVFSPGRLPGPVTVANIADERFSRNAAIVQVLADMGFIERLGYGVDRILALMRQAGLRRPHFEETAGGFRVTLYGPGEAVGAGRGMDPARWRGLELHLRQEQALNYLLGHRRITNREYQDLCPDVHAETIRRDLADLVSKGVVLKIGDKRATYYILKE